MPAKRAASQEVVGYWGNGDGKDLKDYCGSDSGYDIIVMSFISNYGNGAAPSGGFNEPSSYCQINSDGSGDCPTLAADMKTCQSNGKKLILSLGGGGASGTLASNADGEGVAYSLWNSYGNPQFKDSGDNSPRPFGDIAVDGFDLDVERSDGQEYYVALINKLREYFARDTSKTRYITGAPQCVLPEANMGKMIDGAAFDKLFVQFYNNYENCDASNYVNGPQAEGAAFNYDDWVTYLNGTPSKNAQVYVGIPASPEAAASQSYIDPQNLPKLTQYMSGKDKYAGIMFWEAAESDKYSNNGCDFAQEVSHIFKTGGVC